MILRFSPVIEVQNLHDVYLSVTSAYCTTLKKLDNLLLKSFINRLEIRCSSTVICGTPDLVRSN